MKKAWYFIIIIAFVCFVLAGCSNSSKDLVGGTDVGQFQVMDVGDLVLHGGINAGEINVTNDEENLYVEFVAYDDWFLGETHLAVADTLEGIPQNRADNPIPGHFLHNQEHDQVVKEYTYEISLAEYDYNSNDLLYLAAHANVQKFDEEGNVIQEETAWGDGEDFEGKNWATYFNYLIIIQSSWLKTLGGVADDGGHSLILDQDGNVNVLGYFKATTDFNPDEGIDNRTSNGDSDVFFLRLGNNGDYQWVKTIGGSGADGGGKFAIDAEGNLYYSGVFSGTVDFDPSIDDDTATSNGSFDIFLSRLNRDLSYGWTYTVGGSGYDTWSSPVVDSMGNLVLSGMFRNTVIFDPGPPPDSRISAGINDIFLTHLQTDMTYISTDNFGSGGWDSPHDIAIDVFGNLYHTGGFEQTVDFDPGQEPEEVDLHTSHGNYDFFLTKFYPDGEYAWTKTFGGPWEDSGIAVTTDVEGNIYVNGGFAGTVDFDPGPDVDLITAGVSGTYHNSFTTRFDSDGEYAWTRPIIGTGPWDSGQSIAVTSDGIVYSVGLFNGTADFDPGLGPEAVDYRTSQGGQDGFISRLTKDGIYLGTHVLSSTGNNRVYSVIVDSLDNAYLTGYFSGTVDFGNGETRTSNGGTDIFIMKIVPDEL